jgi:hypothetical protein
MKISKFLDEADAEKVLDAFATMNAKPSHQGLAELANQTDHWKKQNSKGEWVLVPLNTLTLPHLRSLRDFLVREGYDRTPLYEEVCRRVGRRLR